MTIKNRKAFHDYFVEEQLECGIVLRGNEVKSIKAGKASIKEAYCQVENGQLILHGMRITRWGTANAFDVDELRDKVLLAHKYEILRLAQQVKLSGYTLIPLDVYLSDGRVKVTVGLCRGKHNYDKRDTLKKRQMDLDARRVST